MTKRCEQVCTLPALNGYDCLKRVYSDKGICPTIPTGGGGNVMPKILVILNETH